MAQDVAANAIGAWLHGLGVGAAHAAVGFHNYVESQPSLQQGVSDLVSGIVNGSAAKAAPVKAAAKAAPAPAAAPSGPKAPVYSQAYLDAQPNFVQQAAMAGKSTPAASAPAAPAAPPTPLDVVRAAAMNNGGLSLSQLGALSEAVSRTVPQQVKPVPLTAKEQISQQYMQSIQDYAARTAKDPTYAKSDLGATQRQLIEDYRAGLTQPNLINDAVTGTAGMPMSQ